MGKHPATKIERWFFVPPVAALLSLLIIHVTGSEIQVFLWLNHRGQFVGDIFWINLTTLGDGLVACVVILPFIRRKPELAWTLIVSWLLAALWTKGIKNLISIPRPLSVLSPSDFRVIGALYKFNSFPSGHSATAAAFAATLCLFYRQKWLRAAIIAVALLICLSRIVMGLHWPTDILVGFLGGWLLALLAYPLAGKLHFGTHPVAQLIFGLILLGAAIRMLLVNQTDYPQAFRLLQTIALGRIVFTVCDFLLGLRQVSKTRSA